MYHICRQAVVSVPAMASARRAASSSSSSSSSTSSSPKRFGMPKSFAGKAAAETPATPSTPLTNQDIADIGAALHKVEFPSAKMTLPEFAKDFLRECLASNAVHEANKERGVQNDDPIFHASIRVFGVNDDTPIIPGEVEAVFPPLRVKDASRKNDTSSFFEQIRHDLDISENKLWLFYGGKQYAKIAEVGGFCGATDPPCGWEGDDKIDIFIDASNATQAKLFIRLNEYTPPILWIGIQAKLFAVQRILREFKFSAVQHAKKSRYFWESLAEQGEALLSSMKVFKNSDDPNQFEKCMNLAAVCRRLPNGFKTPGAPDKQSTLYLGPWNLGDSTWEELWAMNPFLHAWPVYRSFAGGQMIKETIARKFNHDSEASAADFSVWVTKYSKSVLVVHHRMDVGFCTQMEWAEGCAHSSKRLDETFLAQQKAARYHSTAPHRDSARYHQFVTVLYPESKMMHGGNVPKRYNAALHADFPHDMPVDVLGALQYFRNHGSDMLYREVEQRSLQCASLPIMEYEQLLLNPTSPWLLFSDSLVKLGIVGHEEVEEMVESFQYHPSPAIRWAAAKCAQFSRRMVFPPSPILLK